MHIYQFPKASTNISVELRIIDSTDGTPETGVVFNTTGLALEYRRDGAASIAITEVTLAALTTAHADGGFLHIGNGVYRFDLPDAALATGVDKVAVHGTVTGMVVIGCVIQLVSYDPFDAVRLGLTALPNAAADAAGGLIISDAGGQDFDALIADIPTVSEFNARTLVAASYFDPAADTVATVTDVTNQVTADMTAISGDATAANNLELQYDTTGLAGDTFPATQAQVSSIAAAPGVGARPFVPSTITVTTGSGASGDADDMANDDADVYTVNDNAGTLTLDLDYLLDPNTEVIQFLLTAAAQGNSDDLTLQFFDQVGATYDTIDTLNGANALTYETFDKVVVSRYTDDTGLFQVRITGTGLSSATLTINKAVAYGVATVAGIPNGSTITLAAAATNTNYVGQHWTLALGGQDITGSFFSGADVSGIATSTGDYEFEECDLGAVTLDNDGHFERCGLNGTFTVGQAGTFTFHQCFSEAAANVPIDFGALGATTVNLYDFHGGVTLTNMAAGDIAHVTGNGVITTATCTGGTIDHDGFFEYIDAGGNVTEAVADIEGDVQAIQGATFNTATDSLEAIRDRGDAAWTTGAGGSDRLLLIDTTIATLASQTSFTLTAGSADNDTYNNCTIVIEDVATATQKAIGVVLDYVGSSLTITLKEALSFTIATTDNVYILAENSLKSTVPNRQLDVTATGGAGIDWANVENPTTALDLSGTDIQLADTVTTLTGHTAQTADHTAGIADIPTVAEFDARTLVAASYFDPAADAVANVTLVATTTTNTDMRGTDGANTTVPDAAGTAPTAVENRQEMDSNSVDLNTIISTLGTAGAGLTDLGGMSTGMQAEILAEVVQVLVTQMTESYAADGTAPTLTQAVMLIQQALTDFSIAGTTTTIREIDGATTAATLTLDDATNPTSATRAT